MYDYVHNYVNEWCAETDTMTSDACFVVASGDGAPWLFDKWIELTMI